MSAERFVGWSLGQQSRGRAACRPEGRPTAKNPFPTEWRSSRPGQARQENAGLRGYNRCSIPEILLLKSRQRSFERIDNEFLFSIKMGLVILRPIATGGKRGELFFCETNAMPCALVKSPDLSDAVMAR
jgi:hypothetical protein